MLKRKGCKTHNYTKNNLVGRKNWWEEKLIIFTNNSSNNNSNNNNNNKKKKKRPAKDPPFAGTKAASLGRPTLPEDGLA